MNNSTKINDLLDPDKIKANLRTRRVGSEILVYKSTSSTNDIAAEYAKNKNNDGMAIFAEYQTTGRGRSPNIWTTENADSILTSIILTKGLFNPELLSLTTAVATAEAVGKKAKIKWPNDIIMNGKKVAGILLEAKPINSHIAYIIGIGINCHQKQIDFPPQLRQIATSIDIETNSFSDRISIAKRLLTSLDHWIKHAQKSSKKIIKQWQKLSIQLGHRVTVIFDGRKFTGNCVGIDPQKGLILKLDTGGIRIFDAAHTTIEKPQTH